MIKNVNRRRRNIIASTSSRQLSFDSTDVTPAHTEVDVAGVKLETTLNTLPKDPDRPPVEDVAVNKISISPGKKITNSSASIISHNVEEKKEKSGIKPLIVKKSEENFARGTISSNSKQKVLDIQKLKKSAFPPKKMSVASNKSSIISLNAKSTPSRVPTPPFSIERIRNGFLKSSRKYWKEFDQAELALLETYTILGLESPIITKPPPVKATTTTYNPVKQQKSSPSRHKEAKVMTVIENLNKSDLIALKEDGRPVDSVTRIVSNTQLPAKKVVRNKVKKITNKIAETKPANPAVSIPISNKPLNPKNEITMQKLKQVVEDWKVIESTVSYLNQVYNVKDQTATKSLVKDGNLLKSKASLLNKLTCNMKNEQEQNAQKVVEDIKTAESVKAIQNSLENGTPADKTLGDNKVLEDFPHMKVSETLLDKSQVKETFVNKVAKCSLKGSTGSTDLLNMQSTKVKANEAGENAPNPCSVIDTTIVQENPKTLRCVYCGPMRKPFQKDKKKYKHRRKRENGKLIVTAASKKDSYKTGTIKPVDDDKISNDKDFEDTSNLNSPVARRKSEVEDFHLHLTNEDCSFQPRAIAAAAFESHCMVVLQEKENLCFGDLPSNDNKNIEELKDKEELIENDIGGDDITCPLRHSYLSPLQTAEGENSNVNSHPTTFESLTYRNIKFCGEEGTNEFDDENNLGAESEDSLEEDTNNDAESVDSLEELSNTHSNNHFFKALCLMRFKLGSKDSYQEGNTFSEDNNFESETEPTHSEEKTEDESEITTNKKLLNLSFCKDLDCDKSVVSTEYFEEQYKTRDFEEDEDIDITPDISLSHLGDHKTTSPFSPCIEEIENYYDNVCSVSSECFNFEVNDELFLENDTRQFSVSSMDPMITSSCDVMNISTQGSSAYNGIISSEISTPTDPEEKQELELQEQHQTYRKCGKTEKPYRLWRSASMTALVDENEILSSLEVSPFNSNDDLTAHRCCCSHSMQQHNYLPLPRTENIDFDIVMKVKSRRNTDVRSTLSKPRCLTRFCKWCNRFLNIQK